VRVLKSLADAFNVSAETMLEQAGLLDDQPSETADTEAAIRADPKLTEAQKEAMLGVYRSFTGESET
jgi:hypothetical protein